MTAPTAEKAATIPTVMADAKLLCRRNRTPSTMSPHTRDMSNEPIACRPDDRIGTPVSITAENANVAPSSHSGRKYGWSFRYGKAPETPTRNAEIAPPKGRVPYVVARPSELAFASCRRGTRLGSDASRAGVHSNARDSIT